MDINKLPYEEWWPSKWFLRKIVNQLKNILQIKSVNSYSPIKELSSNMKSHEGWIIYYKNQIDIRKRDLQDRRITREAKQDLLNEIISYERQIMAKERLKDEAFDNYNM